MCRCRSGRIVNSALDHRPPTSLDLRHHRQPHALQVLGTTADGYSLDLRAQAKFTSADPNIATVDAQAGSGPSPTGRRR